MAKVIIIGLKSFDFENEKKQRIEVTKLTYLTNTLSPKNNEIGYLPTTVNVNVEVAKTLKSIPALYEVDYSIIPGKNNKPEVVISGFTYLNEVDYLGLFE